MYTITRHFSCLDHLSIEHEVTRAFTGETKEEVAIQIARFSRSLDDCGWTIVKNEEVIPSS